MHRTVMGVVTRRAIGELRHLQRAQPDRAGVLQALQCGRCHGRDEIAPDLRAARDDLAGLVIHVLVRQRHPMQRAAVPALRERRVRGVGSRQRGLRLDRHERVEARLPAPNSIETGLRCLARRSRLRAIACATEVNDSEAGSVLIGRPWSRRRRPARSRKSQARDRTAAVGDGRKAFERRAERIGDPRGDFGTDGHAGDLRHRLDLPGCRPCHARLAPSRAGLRR